MSLKRRKPLNPIGGIGRLSETRLAKQLGGRLTPASGALFSKGDIDLGPVLLEAKSTIKDSLSVKFDWLSKIAQEARNVGKTPALAISFVAVSGKAWPDGEWVCLPRQAFEEILNGDALQEGE